MREETKCSLLQLARQAVRSTVCGGPLPHITAPACDDLDHAGAFVTIRVAGRLRGCIGTFRPVGSLAETVREMAVSACCDPRFTDRPIRPDELPRLSIQISVLSPLQRTDDPCALEIGKHGIYIRRGRNVGCFLPQVATEMNWDAKTFLSQCCTGKAGLPAYAWQDRDTEVYLFTATCFADADPDDSSTESPREP